jgi:anti-sigma B factor antagonist
MDLTVLAPSARRPRNVRPAPMDLVAHGKVRRTVVVLPGETDLPTSPALSDVLGRVFALGPRDVVIDLAEAEFLGTSSVGVLTAGQRLPKRGGRQLNFQSVSTIAAWVLDLIGLADLIDAHDGPRL